MSEQDLEDLDSTNETMDVVDLDSESEETTDTDTNDEAQDSPTQEELPDADELREKNKRLFERAKKAEAELKKLKSQKPAEAQAPLQTNQQAESLSRDEVILIAQGFDETSLEELKSVAKGKGIPLMKAKEDPLFQAWHTNQEAEKKKARAKELGASNGSGSVRNKSKFTPGQTQEDHKEAWKEKVGL